MIRLVDVHKAFGPKQVLNGFTLDVLEGETMVIPSIADRTEMAGVMTLSP